MGGRERERVCGRKCVWEIECVGERVCLGERVCVGERVCGRAWESESVGERERGLGGCGRGRECGRRREIAGERVGGTRERASVEEQEKMWERTENVGTDLDLSLIVFLVCFFDLILNVPSTIFQLNRDGSSWVEPVLS